MKKCRMKGIRAFTLGCHPKLDSGSGCFSRGFTLIELLVVVLIIGILAAVALPQYQRAVLKSRYATLMPLAKAVANAQEIYYEGNGSYADQAHLGDLDISIPAEETDVSISVYDSDEYSYVLASRGDIDNHYIVYQKHSANYPGEIHCEADHNSTRAQWLCKEGLNGRSVDDELEEGWDLYALEGSGVKTTSSSGGGGSSATSGPSLTAWLDLPFCNTTSYYGGNCTVDEERGVVKSGINEFIPQEDANGNNIYLSCAYGQAEGGGCVVGEYVYEKIVSEDGKTYTDKSCQTLSQGVCTHSDSVTDTYDDQGRLLVHSQRECYSAGSNDCYGTDTVYTYSGGNVSSQEYWCSSIGSNGECIDPYIDD